MALNKQKKVEYICHVLQEVMNSNIVVLPDREKGVDDTILVEVALDFVEDLKEGKSNGGT
jgi:hypothetical protein